MRRAVQVTDEVPQLHRPNVALQREPFNEAAFVDEQEKHGLPELELDYPTSFGLKGPALGLADAAIPFALLVGLRVLLAVFPEKGHAAVAVVALLVFAGLLIRRGFPKSRQLGDLLRWTARVAMPLIVWLGISASTPYLLFPLFVVALVFIAHYADQVGNHFDAFSFNLPEVRPDAARTLKQLWRPTSLLVRLERALRPSPIATNELERTELLERAHYDRTLVVLLVAVALGSLVLFLDPIPVRGTFLGFVAVVAPLALLYALQRPGPKPYIEQVWFDYNTHGSRAPGLLESPVGEAAERCELTENTRRLFILAAIFGASFFPVPVLSTAALEHITATTPDGWLFGGPAAVVQTGPGMLAFYVLALALGAFAPPFLFSLTFQALVGRRLRHVDKMCANPSDYTSNSEKGWTEWPVWVDRLSASVPESEARPLFFGENPEVFSPVFIDRGLLGEHAHIMGSTGSGKTARAIAPMIAQLADSGDAIVVLDMKGDPALFQQMRASAREHGGEFRWFTQESGRPTFSFNPLAQSHLRERTPLELTEITAKALGLEYGEGYGPTFFSRQNRGVLLKLLKSFPEDASLAELAWHIETRALPLPKREQDAGADLFATVRALANVDALNVTANPPVLLDAFELAQTKGSEGMPPKFVGPDPLKNRDQVLEHAIDFGHVVDPERPRQFVYFHLPAALGATSLREIGKFALQSLLTAAYLRGDSPSRRVWLFADEFQEIVSRDIQTFLKQARSMGIGVILANQTLSQLDEGGPSMVADIEENTTLKVVFSANDPGHRRVLTELSGETVYHLLSFDQEQECTTVREDLGARLRPNDLIGLGAQEDLCLVHFKRNRGFSCYDGFPFIARTFFHITGEEYTSRQRSVWKHEPGTFVPPLLQAESTAAVADTKSALDNAKPGGRPGGGT